MAYNYNNCRYPTVKAYRLTGHYNSEPSINGVAMSVNKIRIQNILHENEGVKRLGILVKYNFDLVSKDD